MTFFRPCIDLHLGVVKQIVGGTLTDVGAVENHASEYPPAYFARKYRDDGLEGGHVIKLGPGNDLAAREALAAWPGGLQLGGGISASNAAEWLAAGASKVIVTSWLFPEGVFSEERARELCDTVGKERVVIDVSCRRKPDKLGWFVAINRWQDTTDMELCEETLNRLAEFCSEFLVHAADVEGLCQGIDTDLVVKLGEWSPIPCTYAGGAKDLQDLTLVKQLSQNRVGLTLGSALDIFGGDKIKFSEAVAWNHAASVNAPPAWADVPARNLGPRWPKISALGIGTTWMGFPWPPGRETSYTVPKLDELLAYFDTAQKGLASSGRLLMVDTAAGYAHAEKELARVFAARPALRGRCMVASKFGELRHDSGDVTFALSPSDMLKQCQESARLLWGIDLLYIHLTGQLGDERALQVLRDKELRINMLAMRQPSAENPSVPLLGASISSSKVLAAATKEGLLGDFDAIQLPRRALLQESDAVSALRSQGIAIVVNSPVRHLKPGEDIATALNELASNDLVDIILTGSRKHLADTAKCWTSL